MYDNILVDGRNVLFRAVMASKSSGFSTHPMVIMIRMMDKWRRVFEPLNWRVFWDVKKETLWRREIYSEYKKGRPNYSDDVQDYLKISQKIAVLVFSNMAITQYIKESNEADDLIYSFVLANRDKKNLIVTSDGDALQIPYHLGVDLYNPKNKDCSLSEKPDYDPVIVKSLAGDKSDNISNYRLVRDLTAHKIIDNGLDDYLNDKGRELYDLNNKLVDLSKNPYLDDNIDYVTNVKDNSNFDLMKIRKILSKYNISGLNNELITKVRPFKNN